MTTIVIKNDKTGQVLTLGAAEALDYVDRGWKIIGEKKLVEKRVEPLKSLNVDFEHGGRSPDYVEEQEKKMKKSVPFLKIGKYSLFTSKPFIR